MKYTFYLRANPGILLISVESETPPHVASAGEYVQAGGSHFRRADLLAVVTEESSSEWKYEPGTHSPSS